MSAREEAEALRISPDTVRPWHRLACTGTLKPETSLTLRRRGCNLTTRTRTEPMDTTARAEQARVRARARAGSDVLSLSGVH